MTPHGIAGTCVHHHALASMERSGSGIMGGLARQAIQTLRTRGSPLLYPCTRPRSYRRPEKIKLPPAHRARRARHAGHLAPSTDLDASYALPACAFRRCYKGPLAIPPPILKGASGFTLLDSYAIGGSSPLALPTAPRASGALIAHGTLRMIKIGSRSLGSQERCSDQHLSVATFPYAEQAFVARDMR